MTRTIILGLIALFVLAFVCVRCDGQDIQTDLTERASTALAGAGIAGAGVALDGRELTLTGEVPSEDDKARAEEIARETEGVRSVDNQLVVMAPPPSPYVTTATLAEQRIVLEGLVPDDGARGAVVSKAGEIVGADNVDDRLEVIAGAPQGWQTAMESAIGNLSEFEQGKASLSDSDLTVTGSAPTSEIRDQAQSMISSALPSAFNATYDITVPEPAAPPSPYVTSATLGSDGKVVLEGLVPDEEAKTWLTGAAQDKFGADNVEDRLEIAAGAPDVWQGAMEGAVNNLNQFDEGKATLTDAELNVVGKAASTDVRDRVQAAISGALPAGAMSKFDIEAPEPPPVEVAAAPSQPLQPEDEACQGQLGELLGAQVILFETSKWDISDKGKALLDRVVGIVATCPEAHLTIVGRADPRGAAEDNQALSENRAEAVVAYLTEVGVSPSRLTPIGYGETFPLGTDEETLAKSRRIEFIVGRK